MPASRLKRHLHIDCRFVYSRSVPLTKWIISLFRKHPPCNLIEATGDNIVLAKLKSLAFVDFHFNTIFPRTELCHGDVLYCLWVCVCVVNENKATFDSEGILFVWRLDGRRWMTTTQSACLTEQSKDEHSVCLFSSNWMSLAIATAWPLQDSIKLKTSQSRYPSEEWVGRLPEKKVTFQEVHPERVERKKLPPSSW